jgi:hypothetical protein
VIKVCTYGSSIKRGACDLFPSGPGQPRKPRSPFTESLCPTDELGPKFVQIALGVAFAFVVGKKFGQPGFDRKVVGSGRGLKSLRAVARHGNLPTRHVCWAGLPK